MPKLSKELADRVGEADGSFTLIPDGPISVILKDVRVSDKEGKSGYHYWTWDLEVDEEGEFKGRKLWYTTSLSPQSDFAMKGAFEAFGYSVDSDTDEMLGERCTAIVSHRVAEGGKLAGQVVNDVNTLLPHGDEEPF